MAQSDANEVEIGISRKGPRLTKHSRDGPMASDPKEYLNALTTYALQSNSTSVYSGVHFSPLVDFLSAADDKPDCANVDSVHLYTFKTNGAPPAMRISTKDGLKKVACGPSSEDEVGRLLFMTGEQHPEWLKIIGSAFSVDYEFFRRHIERDRSDMTSSGSSYIVSDMFTKPFLPSTQENIVQLPLTTLGTYHTMASVTSSLSSLRKRLQEEALPFRPFVAPNNAIPNGESWLRALNIHNGNAFSIEQVVSVYVGERDGRWIVMLWSDVGHGLPRPSLARLLRCDLYDLQCSPIISHRAHTIRRHQRKHNSLHETFKGDVVVQNLWSLGSIYGRSLDFDGPVTDVFYLLSELFELCAASEQQFILMMYHCLKVELAAASDQSSAQSKMITLENLQYNKDSLSRHIHRLECTLAFLQTKDDLNWNISEQPSGHELLSAASAKHKRLLKDYKCLLQMARNLAADINSGMNSLTNTAMIDESTRAIGEAERVTKLTSLAFFFIPLSFTASCFGMNFKEFADESGNRLHIWVWVIVSIMLLATSYCFLHWETWYLKYRTAFYRRRQKRRAERQKKEEV